MRLSLLSRGVGVQVSAGMPGGVNMPQIFPLDCENTPVFFPRSPTGSMRRSCSKGGIQNHQENIQSMGERGGEGEEDQGEKAERNL